MRRFSASARRALLVLAMGTAAPLAAQPILYAGTYTSGSSKGIYGWRFDERRDTLTPLGLLATAPQPAHIWIAPGGGCLYSVNWETDGGVSAYAIDHKTGALRFLDRMSALGKQPNQIVLDPSGRLAVAVTYNTGNVVAYRVLRDGSLSAPIYVDQHVAPPGDGKPPMPRTHGIAFSPDGKRMYVADLGLDRVYVYLVDARAGTISPAAVPFVSVHAGAGPRRAQVSPDGRFLYVNHETDGEVSVFAIDEDRLAEIQTVSTLPAGFTGRNLTAEIVLSADGRHLYVSNRGNDSIAAYAVDRASGRLTRIEIVPAGGATPRNIRLSPDGRHLFVANEAGGSITSFQVQRDGRLTPGRASATIDTPGGLFFLEDAG